MSLTPTLQSSVFSDPDVSDTHAASQWQITTTSGNYSIPVWDSATDTINKTSIAVPATSLVNNMKYYWQVRHQDSQGAWSAWSAETNFTTLSNYTTTIVESFSSPITAQNLKAFGPGNQFTFSLDRNGTFIIDGTSGLAWQKSDSYLDSAIIRSTNPLPPTYKISVVVGDIDYGLEKLNGLQNDPNYPEGPLNENGSYFLSITDELPNVPHTNIWWHQHRKVVIDVDNNIWGAGMPNPVFMVYFDKNNNLVSYDGDQNIWQDQWKGAIHYQANTFYRIEIEKTLSAFILRTFSEDNQLLKEAMVNLTEIWHDDGLHQEYFVIGDPHENYYAGSMKIKEIKIEY